MLKPNFTLTLSPIRLGEFDMGGVLYHARYFHLLEECREAFFRHISHPYSELTKQGYHLPLTHSELNFKAPIRYGDTILAELQVEKIGKIRLKFTYELFIAREEKSNNRTSNPVHTASTLHAVILEQNGKFVPSPLPPDFTHALEKEVSTGV